MSRKITTNILEEAHWQAKHSAPVPPPSPDRFYYLTHGIEKGDERHETIMANHQLWQQKMDVKRYHNRKNYVSSQEESQFLSSHSSMGDFGNDAHIARRDNRIGITIIALFVIGMITFFSLITH